MRLHTKRPARSTVRLGLETLEDRTLLNGTLPTSTLGNLSQSLAGQTSLSSALQTQSTTASYTYAWSVGPGPVLTGTNSFTGNGKSTGSVVIPLYPGAGGTVQVGGPAGNLPIGLVLTSSSAGYLRPDSYNVPLSISVRLQDSASGKSGTLTFQGTLRGTLTWNQSSLAITFTSTTQSITLGSHTYTVALPGQVLHLLAPGYALQVNASVRVSQAAPVAPSPSPPKTVGFSYQGGVGPSSVLTGTNSSTGNGKSTGSVDLALYLPGTASALTGGSAVNVPITVVSTTSSAGHARPDQFNTALTVTLRVKDSTSGTSGTATFHGTLSGTMSFDQSSLTITFSSITQTLHLGGRTYTVMLQAGLYHLPAPGHGSVLIQAQVRVS